MTRSNRRREPRSDPWPLIVVVLGAVLLALLGLAALTFLGSGPGDVASSPTPAGSPSGSAVASPSATPAPSTSPMPAGPSPDPSSTVEPSPAPSASPTTGTSPTPVASPSPGVDPVTACTGSDENREFFSLAADQLPFDVYCGSLPGGWTLTSGSYRGTDGGRLLVAYQRSGGAALFLREGNFCAGAAGDLACLPQGTPLGPAQFGDLEADFVATEGGYAVVVRVSPKLAYVLEAIGVGEEGTRTYAEDLVLVP